VQPAATVAEPLGSSEPAADAITAGAESAPGGPAASAARPPRGDLLPDRNNPFHQHAVSLRLTKKKQERAAAALAKKTAAAATRAAAAAAHAAMAAKVAQDRAAAGLPPARRRGSRAILSPPSMTGGAAASQESSSLTSAPAGLASTARPHNPMLDSVIQPSAAAVHIGAAADRPAVPLTPAPSPSAALISSQTTGQAGTTFLPAAFFPPAIDSMLGPQSGPTRLTPTSLLPNSDGTLPSTPVAEVNNPANTSAALFVAEAAAAVTADFAAVSGSRARLPVLQDARPAAMDTCKCAAVESNNLLRKRISDQEEALASDKRLRTLLEEHEKERKKRRVATNKQMKELRKVSTAIQSEVGAVKMTMKAVVKTVNLVGTAINHGNAAMKDVCRAVNSRGVGSGTFTPATNTTSMVTADALTVLKEAPWAQQMMVRGTLLSLLFLCVAAVLWTSGVSCYRECGFYVCRRW